MIYNNITELVGNTPLIKVPDTIHQLKNIDVYIKLELFNPWGSVKDRTVLGMTNTLTGDIKDGKKLLELSSGNTAKALQIIASTNGSKSKTITNRIKIPEQRDILKFLGADIEELPGKSDCYDPNDPNDPMIIINREMQSNPGDYIFTNQYSNQRNQDIHYHTTGSEIADELGKVDYFISGLGTTGSSGGILKRLREDNPDIAAIGVVSDSNDYIPGIRTKDEVSEVGLFSPDNYAEILSYSSNSAIDGMLILAQKLGILAGPTTGATLMGSLDYLRSVDTKLTTRKSAVLIACDRMEWYTSYVKQRRPELYGGDAIKLWHEAIKPDPSFAASVLNVEELMKKKNPLIIDTRSKFAYGMGHIGGSVNFPYSELSVLLNDVIPFEKGRPIIFVCAVGEKSLMVASYLRQNEYEAYSLSDGIIAWRDADRPLEKSTSL